MAVTVTAFNYGLQEILKGVDFENDALKIALLNTSHTTNIDTQQYLDDVNANELAATGNYVAGGEIIDGSAYGTAIDTINDLAQVEEIDPVTWSALTASNIRYGVIYINTGTASTSPLLFIINFGTTYSPSGQDFTITWLYNVLLQLAQA